MRTDINDLLNKWLTGDDVARNELFDVLYDNLREMAKRYIAREEPSRNLQASALVNEAFLKVQAYQPKRWQSDAHFYAVFARAMRQILVDSARQKLAAKRGSRTANVTIDDIGDLPDRQYIMLLELDILLDELTEKDPLASSVFHSKHFIGLSAEETAAILNISVSRVDRSFRFAKLWLQRELISGSQRQLISEGQPANDLKEQAPTAPHHSLLSQTLYGILRFKSGPPTDEEVNDMTADYLLKKYH